MAKQSLKFKKNLTESSILYFAVCNKGDFVGQKFPKRSQAVDEALAHQDTVGPLHKVEILTEVTTKHFFISSI